MSETSWTKEQSAAISLRGRNLLVSAAAGSGKTAVLVERIIRMITDLEHPVDLDSLLVVTFTKAAASEMKERVLKALEKKVSEDPDNLHLLRQTALLPQARITTIHSFCLGIIKEYFSTIDLDPAFRVAEEAELALMRSDVMADIMEKKYQEGDEDFLEFAESYSGSKTDLELEQIILNLYEFSLSHPWPGDWLQQKVVHFLPADDKGLEDLEWMPILLLHIKAMIEGLRPIQAEAVRLCQADSGPLAYLDAVLDDGALLSALGSKDGYQSYAGAFASLSFKRLSTKKQPMVSEEAKEQVKQLREQIKKQLQKLQKDFFFQPPEEMAKDMAAVWRSMNVLVHLTMEFAEGYRRKKEDRNLLDFGDLEHFALKILVEKDPDGRLVPTAAARELEGQYSQIMIDEYQDSNLVQETILQSISGEREGHFKRFMVGDVKQSIYKFRLAKPEIFMEKYKTYSKEKSFQQRIDLHKNFRSRAAVLESVNRIFRQIMQEELGGIDYDDEAALYPGADYPKLQDALEKTELILIDGENEGSGEEGKELEARAVAQKIREITDPKTGFLLWDKTEQRIAKYSDIVILLRTISGWAEHFVDLLQEMGIPAYSDVQSGYFQTLEIKTMLNYLRILDNPYQDIPFTAILFSPIAGLDQEELAKLRIFADSYCQEQKEDQKEDQKENQKEEQKENQKEEQKEEQEGGKKGEQEQEGGKKGGQKQGGEQKVWVRSSYEAALIYLNHGLEEKTRNKLKTLFDCYTYLKQEVSHKGIRELLWDIYDRTGYYSIMSAMPGGARRKGNLDLLLRHAASFETTSYSGLFQFVRYVERLLKYNVDYGEASGFDGGNAVKIMSIHKSKGLEFPVVFVSGLGKQFNQSDARAKILMHPEYGIGPEYIDHKMRTKVPTLQKKVIASAVKLENLAEELRVLYVAMTRAKEKLILTGFVKELAGAMQKWGEEASYDKERTPYYFLASAGSFLDYVVPAVLRAESKGLGCFELKSWNQAMFEQQECFDQAKQMRTKEGLLLELKKKEREPDRFLEALQESMNYVYPFAGESLLPIKTTVSEIKRTRQKIEEEEQGSIPHLIPNLTKEVSIIPRFMGKQQELLSVHRGSLYHRVLEYMPFDGSRTGKYAEELLQSLSRNDIIIDKDIKSIDLHKLQNFLDSSLAGRMRKAAGDGVLYRETPFVLGVLPKQIMPLQESEEVVLVQGIVDAYFAEGDELVLVDYKTDYVPAADIESFIRRYQIQLSYYEEALFRVTGKRVKEKIIYSFWLSREISIE